MSSRGKFTIDKETGKLVPYGEQKREPTNHLLLDDIPQGIQSMVTGRWYTSKHRLRQEYKELGYTEIGYDNTEPRRYEDPKYDEKLEEDVERAYYAVRDGMAPLSDMDKARCEMANKSYEYNYDRRDRDEFGNLRE